VSFGDWLGTKAVHSSRKKFLDFTDAQKIVRTYGLNTREDWWKYCKSQKKPDNIPTNPNSIYKNKGWSGWGDWLGSGRIANQSRAYLSFEEAKKEYQKLGKHYGLKTMTDWIQFSRTHELPQNLPAQPWHVYSKEKVQRKKK